MQSLELFEVPASNPRQRLGPAAMALRAFALPYSRRRDGVGRP